MENESYMRNYNTSDAELKAVEQLFRQYYKVLRTYAYRFLADGCVAEDIVQDVFFELWNKRNEIHFDGAVKSYLFKSVYNKCLNYLSSKTYVAQDSLEVTDESKILESYLQSQQINQESSLLMNELQNEIDQVIQTFPEQCRKVFLLSREKNLKNKEIAEELDISVKAVEKHISKALKELRTQLKGKNVLLLIYLFSV